MREKARLLNHPSFQLALAIVSIVLAGVSAAAMIGEVRLVSILILFCGGFGAGAALVGAIVRYRADRAAGEPGRRVGHTASGERRKHTV